MQNDNEVARRRYFAEADAAYARLRTDAEAWNNELAERELWEATLLDGLDSDEIWHEDGRVTYRAVNEKALTPRPPLPKTGEGEN